MLLLLPNDFVFSLHNLNDDYFLSQFFSFIHLFIPLMFLYKLKLKSCHSFIVDSLWWNHIFWNDFAKKYGMFRVGSLKKQINLSFKIAQSCKLHRNERVSMWTRQTNLVTSYYLYMQRLKVILKWKRNNMYERNMISTSNYYQDEFNYWTYFVTRKSCFWLLLLYDDEKYATTFQ